MPGIDLGLQGIALGKQRAVLRSQIVNESGKTRPERLRRNPRAGKRPVFNEIRQNRTDAQIKPLDHVIPVKAGL